MTTAISPVKLPIENIKAEFLAAIKLHNTLILSAPPGAGKSTCLPLWLLALPEFLTQKIYLLQPRRVAAKNVACFLAKQLGESVGETVGYRLKNEHKISNKTRLEVITEGILTQIIQNDAELVDCGLVILDEFHERSLNADLAFALTRDVQQGLREDLKILLMSATLDISDLLKKIPDAKFLASEGRSYPVEVSYQAASNARQWREHALTVIKQMVHSHQGSILVFVSGIGDIRFLAEKLTGAVPSNMLLCPLYGNLSLKEQQQAIAPTENDTHKIVLATNIAETSLTIEGVNLVIDCGFEKIARYDAKTMSTQLQLSKIAKASAVQRMGRAGRLMAGKCIRLYSLEDFQRRNEQSISEIQQADLLPIILEAARWGVKTLSDLPMIELPNDKQEQQAWQELAKLSLLDKNKQLTAHGQCVAKLPCHPRLAHMLIKSQQLSRQYQVSGLTTLAAFIAVLLEEKDVLTSIQAKNDSDLRHRVQELLRGKKLSKYERFYKQINKLLAACHQKREGELPLQYCGVLLALAFPERIAKQRGQYGDFLTEHGKGIVIDEQDALAGELFIVAAQLMVFQQKLTVTLSAPVDLQQLLAWDIIQTADIKKLNYDGKTQRISACEQVTFGAIVISEKVSNDKISGQALTTMWCDEVKKQGLAWLNWRETDLKLLTRWRWINQTQPQFNFFDATEMNLLDHVETWLAPFISSIKTKTQLNKIDLSEALMSLLTYPEQNIFKQISPEFFVGPTGRRCPIRYSNEQAPIVSLPMQELYGVSITPSVGDERGNTRIPLIIEILSPAKRPIQITQDLIAFWQGSYQVVQKEMKAQYPKHYWPDDPANAQATRKTKRHLKLS
jgi:ATP-dependent helicase HrpB